MARHIKKKKKRRGRPWLTLFLFSLAAFFVGYYMAVNGIELW